MKYLPLEGYFYVSSTQHPKLFFIRFFFCLKLKTMWTNEIHHPKLFTILQQNRSGIAFLITVLLLKLTYNKSYWRFLWNLGKRENAWLASLLVIKSSPGKHNFRECLRNPLYNKKTMKDIQILLGRKKKKSRQRVKGRFPLTIQWKITSYFPLVC